MTFSTRDIERIIGEQHDYFFSDATRSAAFRIQLLEQLKKTIMKYENNVLEALHKDLRKNAFEAYTTEIGFVLSSISHVVKHLESWMEPKKVKTPVHLQPAKSFIIREPYGSVLIIGPFNYPFQLVMEPLIGAIAGGNCAVVKPSEMTIHTTAVVKQIIEEALPPELVRVVEGGIDETTALIHAPFDYIFFTGSVKVGKLVMAAAADNLTPVTLELGGKSPAIVDQTASLTKAAERIAWGKFANAGQTCVAPDYVLIHESVKDAFIQQLKKVIRRFYGKDVFQSNDYGRIVNEKHFDRLAAILKEDQQHVVFGGRTRRQDLFIEPTIVADFQWSSASMKDELFGPILPILPFTNLGEVIHRVRKLPKPLAAYMFTENEEAAQYFLRQLPFGGGCINDTITHVGNINLPFGGVGSSGMNAYHGEASFKLFTHEKSIMRKTTAISTNVAYPPYGNKLAFVKRLLQ